MNTSRVASIIQFLRKTHNDNSAMQFILDGLVSAINEEGGSLDFRVIALARAGLRVDAIKKHRELTGIGLKESKDMVEDWMSKNMKEGERS